MAPFSLKTSVDGSGFHYRPPRWSTMKVEQEASAPHAGGEGQKVVCLALDRSSHETEIIDKLGRRLPVGWDADAPVPPPGAVDLQQSVSRHGRIVLGIRAAERGNAEQKLGLRTCSSDTPPLPGRPDSLLDRNTAGSPTAPFRSSSQTSLRLSRHPRCRNIHLP